MINPSIFFIPIPSKKSKDSVFLRVKMVEITEAQQSNHWSVAVRQKINFTRKTIHTLSSSRYDKKSNFIDSSQIPSDDILVISDSSEDLEPKFSPKVSFSNNTSEKIYSEVKENDVFQCTKNYAIGPKSETDSAP